MVDEVDIFLRSDEDLRFCAADQTITRGGTGMLKALFKVVGVFAFAGVLISMCVKAGSDGEEAERLRNSAARNNPPQRPQPSVASSAGPQPTRIELLPAATLIKAYDRNEVAADMNYKGRLLRVGGRISGIGKDIADDPYITFGESFKSVNCYFSDRHNDEIAELSKGQSLVVECKCGGKTMGDVIMRDCSTIGAAQIAIDHPDFAKQMAAEKKRRRHSDDDEE